MTRPVNGRQPVLDTGSQIGSAHTSIDIYSKRHRPALVTVSKSECHTLMVYSVVTRRAEFGTR